MGDCSLLARFAFIMTEVANHPFDADEVYKQGANFIALSGIKRPGRSEWVERAARLTISDTDALHHRSYDFVDSIGRHGSPCAVCPSLKVVSYLPRYPLHCHVLCSLVV